MNDKPQQQEREASARKPPIIHLDRSRDYGEVHGDRGPGDPHVNVHFYQYGLPFNAAGVLVIDHPEIAADPKKQARVARLIEKAIKARESAPGDFDEDHDPDDDIDDIEDDDGEGGERGPAPISLEKWARGQQKVEWQLVSDAVTRKLSRRPSSKRDALELLIEHGVVAKASLSPDHRRIVDSD